MTGKELKQMLDDAYQTGFDDGCSSGNVWRDEDGHWRGTMHRMVQVSDAAVTALRDRRVDDGD